jgi:hypothetical protein
MTTRFAQFRNGFLIIFSLMLVLGGLFMAMHIPGKVGHLVSTFVLRITTPIILEISFGTLGIIIVVALAFYNSRREDEYVEMEIPQNPENSDTLDSSSPSSQSSETLR